MTNDYFELIKDQQVVEINSRARLYRHIKTGAQVLSVENTDENKVFGISFITPPADSTGVAHIMEHSVLCGSRKYPVKEPFVELVKGSLNTFVNAMTDSDKTCYPVASQNLQDFYNLVDVYLDAVYYPRITPETLQQEGWHLELDSPEQTMAFKGVVFNEMKGVYSSPDNLMGRYTLQSLFPSNAYGVDSGGNPKNIPDLTYEQFKKFHDTYYHPSNSLIFFYGDDDPAKRLEIAQGYLGDFERIDIHTTIALQPRFDAPQHYAYGYNASEEQENATTKRGLVTINWMLFETGDVEAALAHHILSHILIGTPASPLRKALIDSGLGENLTGGGLDDELRQAIFSTGLKGINPDDAGKVEQLVLDTLAQLARDGIDPGTVEASLNTIEFRMREMNTGGSPRGLIVMFNALSTWLYGGDPLHPLAYEAPLAAIKQQLAANPRYFEGIIEQSFINNAHRSTVLLSPDNEVGKRDEMEERARLDSARAAMTDVDIKRVVEQTRRLKELQAAPDSPEALATIPMLKLADLDKRNKLIPNEVIDLSGVKTLYHDLFTNGITYLDVGFNLSTLKQEQLPYVALFGRALLELGTATEDYVKLSQRIGRETGGIRPSTFTSTVQHTGGEATAWMFMRGKSTVPQTGELLGILKDVLLTTKLDNRERFRQVVLQEKAAQETGLIPGGHRVVNVRLRARFAQADWAAEQMGGFSYLLFLRKLAEQVDQDWSTVLATLEDIRVRLLTRGNAICNVTLDEPGWKHVQPKLEAFIASLPDTPSLHPQWTRLSDKAPEGLTIPTQVNYVGKGANLYDLGYRLDGSILVTLNLLPNTFLWEKVRIQGGAYGVFSLFDQRSGTFTFLSYRDPNLLGTLDAYDNTAQFLREVNLSDDDVLKSIIGTIGDFDAYQLPDAKGYTALLRHLAHDSEVDRQRLRDEVLATDAADIKGFADAVDLVKQHGIVVVLGSDQAITTANTERHMGMQITRAM